MAARLVLLNLMILTANSTLPKILIIHPFLVCSEQEKKLLFVN